MDELRNSNKLTYRYNSSRDLDKLPGNPPQHMHLTESGRLLSYPNGEVDTQSTNMMQQQQAPRKFSPQPMDDVTINVPPHNVLVVPATINNNTSSGTQPSKLGCLAYIARDHIWDLVFLAILMGISFGVDRVDARPIWITKATLYKQSYPLHVNTVPSWTVPLYCLIAPAVIMLVYKFTNKRTWRELYRLVLALLISVFLAAAITNCLKVTCGRLRPNFGYQCWTNGAATAVFEAATENNLGGYAVCDRAFEHHNEARKSFPSGHSSWSAAGLGFLSLFLLGQTQAFMGRGHSWRLVISVLPALGAVAVAVTRVTDYWHHTSDVGTGLVIGYVVAYIVYRQLYPSLMDEAAHHPMYLRVKKSPPIAV